MLRGYRFSEPNRCIQDGKSLSRSNSTFVWGNLRLRVAVAHALSRPTTAEAAPKQVACESFCASLYSNQSSIRTSSQVLGTPKFGKRFAMPQLLHHSNGGKTSTGNFIYSHPIKDGEDIIARSHANLGTAADLSNRQLNKGQPRCQSQ